MSPIRVLIADDHPLFRDGMHGLLDSLEETEVVGEAANRDQLFERRRAYGIAYRLPECRPLIRQAHLMLWPQHHHVRRRDLTADCVDIDLHAMHGIAG